MRDHQPRQLRPIDQDDPRVNALGILLRVGAEGGGGDENPLPRSLALESPRELLNVGSPDCPLPPFGLEVDRIEAETILLDDAVDTLLSRSPEGLSRIPRWTRHTPSP